MKKLLFVLILFSGLIVVSFYKHESILTAYAKFFNINNAKPGADALVVLSGGKFTRIPHALKLYEEGMLLKYFSQMKKKEALDSLIYCPTMK